MTTNHIIISNTGNINGGLKLAYAFGSYRLSYPEPTTWRGLDADAAQSIGARMGKATIECIGQAVRVNAPTGYAPVEGTGQCVQEWAKTTVIAKRSLKVTDAEGTTRDMLWVSGYTEQALTGGIHGDNELLRFPVRLVEQ